MSISGFQIVETDTYNSDYPDEQFVNIPMLCTREAAQEIADAINKHCCNNRFWRVVPYDYVLKPGFKP